MHSSPSRPLGVDEKGGGKGMRDLLPPLGQRVPARGLSPEVMDRSSSGTRRRRNERRRRGFRRSSREFRETRLLHFERRYRVNLSG